MSVNTTLTLIQVVVLALPAIGIYMTVAFDVRKEFLENESPESLEGSPALESHLGHAFHAMRASILMLLFAVCLLFAHLLMILPPDIAGGWADLAVGGVFLSGVVGLMAGVIIFGFGIAFQMAALRDDLGVTRSLEIVIKGQFLTILKRYFSR